MSFISIFAFSLCVQATEAKTEKPKVAVLNVKTTGVDEQYVAILTEVLTAEIHELDRYQVVSGMDIQAMLGFESEKHMLNCDDVSCLAEIGGALGVDKIVLGHVGKLGSTYIVNIKLIDIKQAKTDGRVYQTVEGEPEVVVATIQSSVTKLFSGTLATAGTANPKKLELYPEPHDDHGPMKPPTVEKSAGQQAWADQIEWLWVGVGVGLAAGGVILDTVPTSAKNGAYDAVDFLPLVLYAGGAALVGIGLF